MGCWNGTCGLTNLPIREGDPVKLIILTNKEFKGENVYYCDDAMPLILPVEGTYDDYGSIKNIKISDYSIKVLESLELYIYKKEKYEPFNFNLKDFFNHLERGYLYVKHYDKYLKLGQVMYHKDAYEMLVKELGQRHPYMKKETIKEYQKEELRRKFTLRKEYLSLNSRITTLSKKEKDRYFSQEILEAGLSICGSTHFGYKFTNQYDLIVQNEDLEDYLDELTQATIFFMVLNFMRKSFYGMSGKGSQDVEMYLHKLLAQWVINFYAKKQKEWMEITDESEPCEFVETIFAMYD